MTFKVYALRRPGDIEVRYIGQTGASPESRIAKLSSDARARAKWHTTCGRVLDEQTKWFSCGDIEAVTIAERPTREEIRIAERQMVETFSKLGHRLFNTWLVPVDLRAAA